MSEAETKRLRHSEQARGEENYAKALRRDGENRAAAAAEHRAKQHRTWARYFRRYGETSRDDTVG